MIALSNLTLIRSPLMLNLADIGWGFSKEH